MPNALLQGSYKFWKVFFPSVAPYDAIKGGIPCKDTSPRRMCTHQPEREQEHTINVIYLGHASHRLGHESNNATK